MKPNFSKIVPLVCLICLAAIVCAAQKQIRRKGFLPRAAVLKSSEPRGATTGGCDNHLLVFGRDANKLFFESNPNGLDAWMNLDGRNVKLRLLKTTLYHRDEYGYANAFYDYRYKKIRIRVNLPLLTDYTTYQPARLTLSDGRVRRAIKAFAAPQCDAI
jgi:hypothetical protein